MDADVLAAVEALFHAQVTEQRLHPGAALAVYRHGRLILDLVAGLADTQRGEPVRADTLFQLRSTGKPLASVALLQLLERGRLALDAPVAKYWPAFGRHGKDAVTVRHILTHRGGFADSVGGLHWREWRDEEAVGRALEELRLVRTPGSTVAYYHVAQQWVCAELVRRVDGRPFPEYLRAEITGPLGLHDIYVALPAELERRVAKVHLTEAADPSDYGVVRLLNRPEVHQVPAPAFGVATARDMARLYAALAAGGELDGARILRSETVALALSMAVDGEWDHTLGGPVRRGLGFDLGGLYRPEARVSGAASTARTFLHGGAGTVLCWGDLDLQLGVTFMVNGFRPGRLEYAGGVQEAGAVTVAADDTGAARDRTISDAIRAAWPPPPNNGAACDRDCVAGRPLSGVRGLAPSPGVSGFGPGGTAASRTELRLLRVQ